MSILKVAFWISTLLLSVGISGAILSTNDELLWMFYLVGLVGSMGTAVFLGILRAPER